MLGQGTKDHFFLLTIQLMLNVGMSVLLQLGKLSMTMKIILSKVAIKVNSKRFWKYVASQSKVKQAVGGLMKPDGSQTVDDIDTANTLNKFFGSVFTHEDSADTPSFGDWHLGNSLSTITVTVEDIWNQLCRLKPCKSSGLDNYHPRVLLELKEGLVEPLYMIFSISLRDGVLPSVWKKATVTPIHIRRAIGIFLITIDPRP